MPAETPLKDWDYFPVYGSYATIAALFDNSDSSSTERQSYIDWHANTGVGKKISMDDNAYIHSPFNNNRQFIQIEQSFLHQIQQNPEIFDGQNIFTLKEKMKISSDAILKFSPENVSLQLTNEGNIFYTFFKDGLTIYLQHFLIDDFDGTDEAIINVFKGHENLLNFGGSLIDCMVMVNKYLNTKAIKALELV